MKEIFCEWRKYRKSVINEQPAPIQLPLHLVRALGIGGKTYRAGQKLASEGLPEIITWITKELGIGGYEKIFQPEWHKKIIEDLEKLGIPKEATQQTIDLLLNLLSDQAAKKIAVNPKFVNTIVNILYYSKNFPLLARVMTPAVMAGASKAIPQIAIIDSLKSIDKSLEQYEDASDRETGHEYVRVVPRNSIEAGMFRNEEIMDTPRSWRAGIQKKQTRPQIEKATKENEPITDAGQIIIDYDKKIQNRKELMRLDHPGAPQFFIDRVAWNNVNSGLVTAERKKIADAFSIMFRRIPQYRDHYQEVFDLIAGIPK